MTKGKEPKFEEAIEDLESIIAKIESGECGLEESIAEYERGVKLLARCQSILQVVQHRIAELTTTGGPGGKLKIKESVDSDGESLEDQETPQAPGNPSSKSEIRNPKSEIPPSSATE